MTASVASAALDETRIAVVIPLYKQPQFVTEAVSSVLSQTEPNVTAVVVNDGCPDPDSHRVGRSLAAAFPDCVTYLRRPNGGLSAARNHGIRFALARFPLLSGVFPLDADNVLDRHAIAVLKARLDDDPSVDWVSPHMQLFGEINRPWRLVDKFSSFRQMFENQADAAALFRPALFRTAAYDESMRLGYEDWEFYLGRLLAGSRGVSEERALLWYRSRHSSMLASAVQKHSAIVDYMRTKHVDWFRPRRRTLLEHADAPRFAIVDRDGSAVACTDPHAAAVTDVATSPPPFVAIIPAAEQATLRDAGLLRGVLFAASPAHGDDLTVLTVDSSVSGIEHRARRSGAPAFAVVLPAARVPVARDDKVNFATRLWHAREVAIGHPAVATTTRWDDVALLERVARCIDAVAAEDPNTVSYPEAGSLSQRDFSAWLHQTAERTTFPLADDGGTHIGFAMPWLRLGGVEHCVLQATRRMRAARPDVRIHVLLTQSGHLIGDPATSWELFDSVTVVAGLPFDRAVRLTERWSASMDVVVNAHSGLAFDALVFRADHHPSDHQSIEAAYLHVVDDEPGPIRHGWPMLAARLEPYIDAYLVISDSIAATARAEGAPPRKLVHAPNAPVVRPVNLAAALGLAGDKASRLAAGGELRILIAGRLDHQKGGARAARTVHELASRGLPVHVSVVGEPTLDPEIPDLPQAVCTWHPATSDPDVLRSRFEAADVLLLLSRWEGVPLAMLDAMVHGAVVVATDVGAIREVVTDGVDALLVPPAPNDDEIGVAAADKIAELLHDPTGGSAIRRAAVETAWKMTWDQTAAAILSLVPTKGETA